MIPMIAGVIERFDDYYVVIRTREGEILYWPKRDIPKDSAPGATVYAMLSSQPYTHALQVDPKHILNTLLLESE